MIDLVCPGGSTWHDWMERNWTYHVELAVGFTREHLAERGRFPPPPVAFLKTGKVSNGHRTIPCAVNLTVRRPNRCIPLLVLNVGGGNEIHSLRLHFLEHRVFILPLHAMMPKGRTVGLKSRATMGWV